MASFSERTAILVDGGFYRLQAKKLFGDKTPEERADELFSGYRTLRVAGSVTFRCVGAGKSVF